MPEQDKDPRVYFAAERTFLAWIRTGLALMGFGFVVARFGMILRELGSTVSIPVKSSGFSLWSGTVLVLIGVVVNGMSAFQHLKTTRDLNEGRGVTGRASVTGIALAALFTCVGVAMPVYLLSIHDVTECLRNSITFT